MWGLFGERKVARLYTKIRSIHGHAVLSATASNNSSITSPHLRYYSYSPFSFLNLSQASFRVLNTALEIILCSVVASVGI
jgi:hypothetical protein